MMSAIRVRAAASFAAAVLVLTVIAFPVHSPTPHPVESSPDGLDRRLELARHYLDTAQFIKAREEYSNALRQVPRDPEVLAQYGWFCFEMGNTDKARQLITQALAIDPSSPDGQWGEANIMLYEQQDPWGALRVLRGLLARHDLPAERQAEVTRLIAAAERALTTTW